MHRPAGGDNGSFSFRDQNRRQRTISVGSNSFSCYYSTVLRAVRPSVCVREILLVGRCDSPGPGRLVPLAGHMNAI